MKVQFRKIRRHVAAYGVRSAISTGIRRLFVSKNRSLLHDADGRIDIVGHYSNILGTEHGSARTGKLIDDKTMQWVIPDFGFGSGGHLNIFRFINNLADLGYKQRLVIIPPYKWKDADAAREMIASWYAPLKADIALGIEGFRSSHITFATGWQTASGRGSGCTRANSPSWIATSTGSSWPPRPCTSTSAHGQTSRPP